MAMLKIHALSITPRKPPQGAAAEAPERTRLQGLWKVGNSKVAQSHLAFVGRNVTQQLLSELSETNIISNSSKPGKFMPGTNASSHMGVQIGRETSDRRQTWLTWWEDGVLYTEKFKELCKRRYFNLCRAWRLLLDPPGEGRVAFVPFCKAARSMGFANVAILWKHLDLNSSGFITLDEWDPPAHRCLMELRQICIGEFGGTLEAFKFGMDANGSGTVTKDELLQFMKDFDFQGDLEVLWNCLDEDRGGFITADELKFLEGWAGERFRPAAIEKQYNLGLARLHLNQRRQKVEKQRLQQYRDRWKNEIEWQEAQRPKRQRGSVLNLKASNESVGLPSDGAAQLERKAENQANSNSGSGRELEKIKELFACSFQDKANELKEDDGDRTLREFGMSLGPSSRLHF